jgi:hypothetical protein
MVTFDEVDSEVVVEGEGAGPSETAPEPEALRRLIREVIREELERFQRLDVERG